MFSEIDFGFCFNFYYFSIYRTGIKYLILNKTHHFVRIKYRKSANYFLFAGYVGTTELS